MDIACHTLDLGLDIVDGVGRFDLKGDSLAREGLDENLHDGPESCVKRSPSRLERSPKAYLDRIVVLNLQQSRWIIKSSSNARPDDNFVRLAWKRWHFTQRG